MDRKGDNARVRWRRGKEQLIHQCNLSSALSVRGGRRRAGFGVPFGFSYKTTFIGNLKTAAEDLNVTLQFTLASAQME
jgi:hypothetical protein